MILFSRLMDDIAEEKKKGCRRSAKLNTPARSVTDNSRSPQKKTSIRGAFPNNEATLLLGYGTSSWYLIYSRSARIPLCLKCLPTVEVLYIESTQPPSPNAPKCKHNAVACRPMEGEGLSEINTGVLDFYSSASSSEASSTVAALALPLLSADSVCPFSAGRSLSLTGCLWEDRL